MSMLPKSVLKNLKIIQSIFSYVLSMLGLNRLKFIGNYHVR